MWRGNLFCADDCFQVVSVTVPRNSMYLLSCFFQVGRTIEIRDLHVNHPTISKNEETYVLARFFFFMCTLAGGKASLIFVN